ncbi:MAG: IS1182 family transposase [Clostridia bacterium]|nr:IS1182 family transposase [Clostridia bacterium]
MLKRSRDMREEIKIVDIESLMPKKHLLREIDSVIDFNEIYEMTEEYYSEDNGRPCCDPVIVVKIAFLQHLFGIRSLRQTIKEVETNIAYRWFLHFNLDTPIPHFATISYAFATRFPDKLFEEIFSWILEKAVEKRMVDAKAVFIDATHIKANANKKKHRKEQAEFTARVYEQKLRQEINADREAHGKKPLKEKREKGENTKEVTVSTTDPDCGLFHKGEHKVEFAYTTHTACDKNNFVLGAKVTAGNVHDSLVFDAVYDEVNIKFEEIEAVAVDAGYKTPWICKKVIDDGKEIITPYKRPMTKKGFFHSYEFVYDEYYDCVICPNNKVLKYSTTNRDGYKEFKSNPKDCEKCQYRDKCTNSEIHQKIVTKHIWSDYIDLAEDIRHSERGKEIYSLRSQTIERVFADAKEKHAMRYTFIKSLPRVQNWVRLKFAAMNLKKLAMWA